MVLIVRYSNQHHLQQQMGDFEGKQATIDDSQTAATSSCLVNFFLSKGANQHIFGQEVLASFHSQIQPCMGQSWFSLHVIPTSII
jgi:hypothetical protein